MKNDVKISVVIPLYNKASCIENTLKSIFSQTFTNYEIIVVNDGSTDNSMEVVNSIDNDKIRLINKPNGGVSSARNAGIAGSKYDYIALLDADDFWEPTYLEEMVYLIRDFKGAKIFGARIDNYTNSGTTTDKTPLPLLYRGIINNYFTHALTHFLFHPSATVLSKTAIQAIEGFDERISMGEDQDLWFRMNLTYKAAFYNKILVHYNQDAPNRAMNKKHDFSKSFLYYTDKYKEWEHNNKEFRKFINVFRSNQILNLFENYDINRKLLRHYIRSIDLKEASFKWRLFCKLPFILQKQIALYYIKHLTYK